MKKTKKEGLRKKNLKKMLDEMGIAYPEKTTNGELKMLFRHAPNKDLIGQPKNKSKREQSTDIFDRRRRSPGNYKG